MSRLEDLCEEMHQYGVETYEMRMISKGLYCDNVVWLNRELSNIEKICVLAEEFGHRCTSAGNILDLNDIRNRKQEKRARNWAYEKLIPLQSFVDASREGVRNRYEFAEFLGVTEDFLEQTIEHYKEKYGLYADLYAEWSCYEIRFEPLGVVEFFYEDEDEDK